jgi:UDP-3-O-[3-hydroxymyristoyl] N-acetylglucosamine deacetylase
MRQRTIAKPVEVVGIGLHKGVPVTLRLEPMEADSGIHFYRSDLGVTIPATPEYVVDTRMATVLGKGEAVISTIEHLLSAITAFGIDNLRIVVDNDEIPIMDGSSYPFVMLLLEAGIRELPAPKKFYKITKEVEVREGNKFVKVRPSPQIGYQFTIKFDHPMIGKQEYYLPFSTANYVKEIARARTFGFLKEVEYLRSIGLALGGCLENAIVLDETDILNDSLRFPDEFVRHKILDAIGDMGLLGHNFIGEYSAFAGGHKLNHLLTQKLMAENAIEEITLGRELTQFSITPAISLHF